MKEESNSFPSDITTDPINMPCLCHWFKGGIRIPYEQQATFMEQAQPLFICKTFHFSTWNPLSRCFAPWSFIRASSRLGCQIFSPEKPMFLEARIPFSFSFSFPFQCFRKWSLYLMYFEFGRSTPKSEYWLLSSQSIACVDCLDKKGPDCIF